VERQAVKDSRRDALANSLEAMAREWHKTIHSPAVSEGQAKRTLGRLEKDIFPWLGNIRIGDLEAPALLKAVRRVESRRAIETARRELQSIGQVIRFAIATGRATRTRSRASLTASRPIEAGEAPSRSWRCRCCAATAPASPRRASIAAMVASCRDHVAAGRQELEREGPPDA
jgi:hypothetical protein